MLTPEVSETQGLTVGWRTPMSVRTVDLGKFGAEAGSPPEQTERFWLLNWLAGMARTGIVIVICKMDDQNTMFRPRRRADGAACRADR